MTYSLDVGSAVADRVLLVLLAMQGGGVDFTSVQYNGQAMTALESVQTDAEGNKYRAFRYALPDDVSGAHNLTCGISFYDYVYVTYAVYSGVDDTTPLSAFQKNAQYDATPSWSVSAASDETVVALARFWTTATVTKDSDVTERHLATNGVYQGGVWEETVTDTPTTTVSGSITSSRGWAGYAVALNPAGGGSDTEAPTVPGGLAVSSRTRSTIVWGWSASSDNVGVTGYEVSEDNGAAIDKGNNLTHTKSGLADGTSVNLKVRAYDAAGNRSAYSANVQGTSYVGKWVVPANAAPSTSARMIVMATGSTPATVAQEGAVTADSNGDFKLTDTTAAALDTQRLAIVHAYAGVPANSFNAAVGVATLTGE
jgi:hypothetical protein